eukprot:g15295.t1
MKKKGADLDDLSSQYFSLIPHDFGRKRPTSIKTQALLQEQQELLKFYLRMGFEEVESSAISPVEGVMTLPVPSSLSDAAGAVSDKFSIKESSDRGAQLAKKQAGKPKRKMTEKDPHSISLNAYALHEAVPPDRWCVTLHDLLFLQKDPTGWQNELGLDEEPRGFGV